MRHIRLACTALHCLFSAALHASAIHTGAPAPALSLAQVLQAPQGTQISWPALRGKVVVLEFWATWCGPCVAEIPHLNQLADDFAGKVQFISVDDEADTVVKKFLASHPMHAWIGLDASGATFKSFNVVSRPTTIVVDANGQIAKIGVPQDVTPALLSMVLKSSTTPKAEAATSSKASSAAPAFAVSFAPSVSKDNSLMASNDGIVQTRNAKATDLLGLIYSTTAPQMIVEASLPEQKFDLKITAPGIKEDALLKISSDIVAASLHIHPHWEDVERSVYILVADSTAAGKLPVSTNTHSGYRMLQNGKLEDVKVSMASLSSQFGVILDTPVLNETNLDGRYDVSLSLQSTTVDAVSEQLLKLGLHLQEAKRVVHSLVIDPE
jgi:uncharacterized protein (TIGR03435 family)